MTKVGLPGATLGLQKEDPTIAELLKNYNYMTFQHGKNHLGDRNEFLPTDHGFDEFFGNLYHLNAEEEPENVDYPKDPQFAARFGPRGVLKTKATDRDDPTIIRALAGSANRRSKTLGRSPSNGWRRPMKNSSPLRSMRWIAPKPLANRFSSGTTRHECTFTHLQKKYQDMVAEKGLYGAGMTEVDDNVGVLLKKLDDLGIANNTIVIFTTDNGAETFSRPDGGTTPFRSEKNTNWEGGFEGVRMPCPLAGPYKAGDAHQRHRCTRGLGTHTARRSR